MNGPSEPACGGASCTTRRALLGAVVAGGASLALGGCAVYGDNAAPAAPAGAGSGGGGARAAGTAAGTAIAKVSDLPVGGGVILADRRIVLTRPSADTVRAFSAVCTHAGCTVSAFSGGTITCPCHGSAFRIADGAVANGPAARPLTPVGVSVDGDAIRLA